MQVGNYIFFLLTWQCCVEWFNLDHAVVTAAIRRQWRRRLSACVQAGGVHFEHYF